MYPNRLAVVPAWRMQMVDQDSTSPDEGIRSTCPHLIVDRPIPGDILGSTCSHHAVQSQWVTVAVRLC